MLGSVALALVELTRILPSNPASCLLLRDQIGQSVGNTGTGLLVCDSWSKNKRDEIVSDGR